METLLNNTFKNQCGFYEFLQNYWCSRQDTAGTADQSNKAVGRITTEVSELQCSGILYINKFTSDLLLHNISTNIHYYHVILNFFPMYYLHLRPFLFSYFICYWVRYHVSYFKTWEWWWWLYFFKHHFKINFQDKHGLNKIMSCTVYM